MNEPAPTQGSAGIAPTRDGRKLFYQQLPGPARGRAPTVVFESGLAASRSFWGLIQPRVAQWTRAVVYDRSGLGRSPPDAQPRCLARMADDLNDLLDHLEPGPFVLVAHSGGGPIVRAATFARPERIVGLVLVDVTDEACDLIFTSSFRRLEKVIHATHWLLAQIGLLEACFRKSIAALPPDVRLDLHREGFTRAVLRTRGGELAGLVAAMNEFRQRPPELPDIPVTVISGGRADGGLAARIRAAINASHRHRAQQSSQGRHVVAERSGHGVILTEPDLVADEIARLLGRVGVAD